jgi:hypothetical protein
MRGEARQMLQGVLDLGKGGTFQSRTERDIVVRTSLARLEQLDIGDQALYFGRIDRFPESGRGHGDGAGNGSVLGESFHIGRLAVSGPDHEPLVVDWRAPVAEPFYRATGLDPQGLARRRHLAVRGRAVLGLEDEYFADPSRAPGAPLLPVPEAGVPARTPTGNASSPMAWCSAAPVPSSPPSARPAPGRWATSSGPSSASRTRSSAHPSPASWWSRAGPGPARRRSRCTGPPTSSTRTASRWNARGCWWSGPIRSSCAT